MTRKQGWGQVKLSIKQYFSAQMIKITYTSIIEEDETFPQAATFRCQGLHTQYRESNPKDNDVAKGPHGKCNSINISKQKGTMSKNNNRTILGL